MIQDAVKMLEAAVQKVPEDNLIRLHLGDAYFENGQWDRALEEWEESLRLNPNNKSLKKKVEEIKVKFEIRNPKLETNPQL
jgi:tetratricopeptide (TPR) repeat protein